MRTDRKIKVRRVLVLLTLLLAPSLLHAQQPNSKVMSANGEGTIKIGREVFKLHAVVAKLFEDGTAELNLATDITVFINATWSATSDFEKGVDLKVTGGATRGGVTGAGKLFLTNDRTSIVSLKLQVVNTVTRRNIEVSFQRK
jgi:hypothetical protein